MPYELPDEAFWRRVIAHESGGRPNVGWGNTDLSNVPLDPTGFPAWQGKPGPAGNSTAAGLYGITGSNWRRLAPGLGVSDFSPESQAKVRDALYKEQGPNAWVPFWTAGGQRGPTSVYDPELGRNVPRIELNAEWHRPGDDPLDLLLLAASQPQPQAPAQDNDATALLLSFIEPPGGPQGSGTAAGGTEAAQPLEAPPAAPLPPRNVLAEAPPLDAGPVKPLTGMPPPDTIEPPGPGQTVPSAGGLVQQGNIDLHNRPIVRNADSSISTVRSMSFNEDGKEVLIPTVAADGSRILSDREAIDQYRKTGQFLGKFDTPEAATAYAEKLHEDQAKEYLPSQGPSQAELMTREEAPPSTGQDIMKFIEGLAQGVALPKAELRARQPQMAGPEKAGSYVGRVPGGMLVEPVRAGVDVMDKIISGQPVGEAEMQTAAAGGAGLVAGGSIGRGGMGAGPRLPGRIEPPPLSENLPAVRPPGVPAAAPHEIIQSLAGEGGGGAGPPGPPRGAVGSATPPPPPPQMPGGMVRTETAPPREPPPRMGKESPEVRRFKIEAMKDTSDTLFKLWTRSEEYKNRVLRGFANIPRLTGEEKLQVERFLEWQPGQPQVAAPSGRAAEIIEKVIKPAQRQAARDFDWLKKEGVVEHLSDESLDEMTQGYVHRMVANRGPMGRHPYEPFAGVRGIRQSTSSQRHRARWFVLEDAEGNRVWNKDTLDNRGWEYGQTFQSQGKDWTVKRPTMEEIEKNTDTRYLHDPVLASLQNMVQLHLARANVQTLKMDILPKLERDGLAVTSREAAGRLGFTESQIPTLRNHYFTPRVTDAFDDFYRSPQVIDSDLTHAFSWIGNINRFAISSMFINPIGHMRNVLSDYVLARGGLWASPPAYARAAGHMRAAVNDVMKLTPFYRDVMKAGGSTMSVSHQNRIAYQTALDKARQDMTTLPFIDEIARTTGVWKTGKAWADATWNASQSLMWGFHDALLMARTRELMADKGLGVETAVREAERFIADYRVPATIGESGKVTDLPTPIARALSILMQDRTMTVFGRYHYDKLKAIGNTLRDAGAAMTKSGMSTKERTEALGRLSALLLISTVLQFGVNFAIQEASGNPEARLAVPGALGIPANAARVGRDLYKGQFGEANFDFWMGLSSILTPLPMMAEGIAQMTNTNYPMSTRPIAGDQLPASQQAAQRAGHAARDLLPPVGDIERMAKTYGLSNLGLSLPDAGAAAWARSPHPRDYRRQERAYQRNRPSWLP